MKYAFEIQIGKQTLLLRAFHSFCWINIPDVLQYFRFVVSCFQCWNFKWHDVIVIHFNSIVFLKSFSSLTQHDIKVSEWKMSNHVLAIILIILFSIGSYTKRTDILIVHNNNLSIENSSQFFSSLKIQLTSSTLYHLLRVSILNYR